MLNLKYNYEKLSRTTEEGQRLYKTPDGNKLPSVTTVLTATQPAKKVQALKEWRDRVGHEKAATITTQAANRGTKMHTYLENFITDGVLADRPSNPFHHTSHIMAETVIQEGLSKVNEVWGVEIGLFMPQMYAGTADGAGVHLGDETIFDYKQTNRPKKESQVEDYYLQLAAYALAHNEIHGTKIRKGVILMCAKPKTDTDGFLILNEDGTVKEKPYYQEFIIEGKEFDHWAQQWWLRLEQYYSLR